MLPKRKIAEMEKLLEEKDRKIEKLNATVHEMKIQQRSEIQYIKTKAEMEKSSLRRKISGMRKEITLLKERRPPSTGRDTEDIGRNRNSPPRLQRTDLLPRLQRTDLPPRLQRTDLPPRQQRTNLPPRLQRTDSGGWKRGWL
jgi:DNA repair exonuclease SbcCD ATPase subunit